MRTWLVVKDGKDYFSSECPMVLCTEKCVYKKCNYDVCRYKSDRQLVAERVKELLS